MSLGQKTVDAAAAISVSSFGISLTVVTQWAQLLAAIVAIVAGLVAIFGRRK